MVNILRFSRVDGVQIFEDPTVAPFFFFEKIWEIWEFISKNMGELWEILAFSWQNLAKSWEIWEIFNHFPHIFSTFSTVKKIHVNPMPGENDLDDTEIW